MDPDLKWTGYRVGGVPLNFKGSRLYVEDERVSLEPPDGNDWPAHGFLWFDPAARHVVEMQAASFLRPVGVSADGLELGMVSAELRRRYPAAAIVVRDEHGREIHRNGVFTLDPAAIRAVVARMEAMWPGLHLDLSEVDRAQCLTCFPGEGA